MTNFRDKKHTSKTLMKKKINIFNKKSKMPPSNLESMKIGLFRGIIMFNSPTKNYREIETNFNKKLRNVML